MDTVASALRYWRLLIIGFFLAACLVQSVLAGERTLTVASLKELRPALVRLRAGDTVLLASGSYGDLDVAGKRFDETVTLRSESPDNPARFDSIDATGAKGLRLEALHINNPNDGDAGSKIIKIVDAERISLVGSEVNATVDGTSDFRDYEGHFAVYVKGSKDISIINNTIHDLRDGITVIESEHVGVIGNHFDLMGHDTIKVISTRDVRIEANFGPPRVYASPKAHKDFIQFGGGNSSQIVIRGNVLLASENPFVQGIFMDDASFSDVLIEENVIYTGMLRGISISRGSNITVRNNTILNMPGIGHKATVIAVPTDSLVENNVSSGTKGRMIGSNLIAQNRDPTAPFYYADLFQNAFAGPSAKLADLRAIEGRAAEDKGAQRWLSLPKP